MTMMIPSSTARDMDDPSTTTSRTTSTSPLRTRRTRPRTIPSSSSSSHPSIIATTTSAIASQPQQQPPTRHRYRTTTTTTTSILPTIAAAATTTTNCWKRRQNRLLVSSPWQRRQRPLSLVPSYVAVVVAVVVFTFLIVELAVPVTAFHLRINGGGPLIIDSTNNNTRWEADTPYNFQNKGNRYNICSQQPNVTFANVSSTVPRTLYCTQRFYKPTVFPPPYQYNIPVPTNDSYYIVKLHFMEYVRCVYAYVSSLDWVVLAFRYGSICSFSHTQISHGALFFSLIDTQYIQ